MIDNLGELYGWLGDRLPCIVRKKVSAPPAVIDDACQIAWVRLVIHAPRIDDPEAVQRLVTTAIREAIKLRRREQRELSLEARADGNGELDIESPLPGPHQLTEWRERLSEVSRLSVRRQRFLWLRAGGYSYEDIAASEPGLTRRTVERQIQRGRRKLRAAA